MSKYDKDADGFETHLLSYPYDGGMCSFHIRATSPEDAQARIAAMHNYGKYDGILKGVYPVAAGWWVPILCWWRNLRGRRSNPS